jgi:hypothetical protein
VGRLDPGKRSQDLPMGAGSGGEEQANVEEGILLVEA